MGHDEDAFCNATEGKPRKTKTVSNNRTRLKGKWMEAGSRFIILMGNQDQAETKLLDRF
jgi:hypothetical protein